MIFSSHSLMAQRTGKIHEVTTKEKNGGKKPQDYALVKSLFFLRKLGSLYPLATTRLDPLLFGKLLYRSIYLNISVVVVFLTMFPIWPLHFRCSNLFY